MEEPLTIRQHWQRRKPIVGLVIGLLLAVVTIYLHSSVYIRQALYGKSGNENVYLWYLIMVPSYTLTFIFGTRFVGSYVVGVWVKEIVNSQFVHRSVLRLTENIVMDDRMPAIIAGFLMEPQIIGAASRIVAKVTREEKVQNAASTMVSSVLQHQVVLDAATSTAERVLQAKEMRDCTADLLRDQSLAKPLASQVARVLEQPLMVDAVTVFMQSIMEDASVRQEIKSRARSIAADPDLYSATRKGLYDAATGRRSEAEDSSQCIDKSEITENT